MPTSSRDTPLPRTIVFDGPQSARGYVVNRFGWSLTVPANRLEYGKDPQGYMRHRGLTERQIALVTAQDWSSLLEEGASVYVLAKLSIMVGGNLVQVGASMRGQSLEDFMRFLASPERKALVSGYR